MDRIALSSHLAPIYRCAELRTVESAAKAQPLMERAGRAAAEVARQMASGGGTVLVLAGPGNNGGDALVVARWLRAWFYDITVVLRSDPAKLPSDAAEAYGKFVAAGGTTVPDIPAAWNGRLIVDGLFGIGLTRPLAVEYATLVDRANATQAPILALDVPSGLDADSGTAGGATIRASATATFLALKPGLLTGDGVDLCGKVTVHTLNLPPEAFAGALGRRLEWSVLAAELPATLARRVRNVHKGTFGTLSVIGGARGMTGAPLLAGRAAMKFGAGKVRIGFAAHEHPAVDWGAAELMLRSAGSVLKSDADALVLGPGLGSDASAIDIVSSGLAQAVPAVLDADALNLIGAYPPLRATLAARKAATILTPHPAEAARLLRTDVASVQRDRLAAAQSLAREFKAHVVLKGAGSVLAHPDGTWDINTSGNPALATAGSGDVLSGLVGALLAQGVGARDALRVGVCVHGAAADALVEQGRGPLGLVASDLADAARDLVNAARGASG